MRDYKSSIVIPAFNSWDLCKQLLLGLEKHEKDNIDEVLIIDDCSTHPFPESIFNIGLPINYIPKELNSGFTLTSNMGLELAVGELAERKVIFLISTDVKVSGRFIDQTADILFGARRHFIGNRHIAFNSGWNTFDGKIFDYLEGWFLGATSDGWKDLGFFDPNYAPFDYEDVDISTAAKQKGYKLTSLNNPYLVHLGGGTIGFNPAREAITMRNKEYFRKKWMR